MFQHPYLIHALLLGICFSIAAPVTQAAKPHWDDDSERSQKKYNKKESRKETKGQYRSERKEKTRPSRHNRDESTYKKRHESSRPERHERSRSSEPAPRDRKAKRQESDQRGLWPYPKRTTVPKHTKREHSSHDRHYERHASKWRKDRHYHRHENYHYHTHYLAPIRHHYHPHGHRIRVLPKSYVRIVLHGSTYFYFGGVFYRPYTTGYIVIRAPIGAYVEILPIGFISFSLGGVAYYYVNDTYYIWDDVHEHYVVVAKPKGADKAIASETAGRLFVYPNKGQSEEQQAQDRYECHRWAVSQSDVDPSLEEEEDISTEDRDAYRRAISACLEGRDYTVK